MNLGQFHDRVAVAFGRGSSLDSSIPGWVEEAVQEIEANKTFQYMKRWTEFSVDASSESPHIVSIYSTPIKRVETIRYVDPTTSRFREVKRINPRDRQTRAAGFPTGYWLNGLTAIVFDAIPDEDLEFEAHMEVYSSWQPDQDAFEHYLIDRHRNLLLSQTILIGNMTLRDERLSNLYGPMNSRGWTFANGSEEDIQSETPDAAMEWSPPYDEFDPNFERNS